MQGGLAALFVFSIFNCFFIVPVLEYVFAGSAFQRFGHFFWCICFAHKSVNAQLKQLGDHRVFMMNGYDYQSAVRPCCSDIRQRLVGVEIREGKVQQENIYIN